MKKIKVLLLALMLTITAVISAVPTSAGTSDLYDDSTRPEEHILMDNTRYGFNVVWIGDQINFLDALGEGTFTISIYGSNGVPTQSIGGGTDFWYEHEDLYMDFTTDANSPYMFIEVSGDSVLAENYLDIQLVVLEDTIPPEYTYSNVSVDTPYYDLVTASEIQAQLQAVDDEDGDVTDRIQVYEDQYTSISPKVVGDEYFIMFMVDDIAGNAAYLRVDINVIDDLKPQLEDGQNTYLDGATFDFSWFDDEYDPFNDEVELFLDTLTIVDDYYGSVSFQDLMALNDGWTFNELGDYGLGLDSYRGDKPGTYTLIHEAIDPSGNKLTFTFNVTVLENNAPVISGEDVLTIEITDFTDLNDVLPYYSATDTEDGDLSVEIMYSYVIEDGEAAGQTENFDYSWAFDPVIGTYDVHIKATDSLGKITSKTITLNLVDTTSPTFKVDGIDSTSYSHTVNMSDTTSLQALIDTITAIDTYDGNLTTSINVPELPSYEVPGTHTLNLTVTDSSNNQATLTIEVTVADDIPPVINGATKIVKGLTETLTLSDILAELTVIDNIDSSLSLVLVSDTYTGNSSNIGSYLVKYKATDTAGNITYHNVRVWVVDNQAPAWIINDYFVNLGINESMTRAELVSLLQSAGMIGSDISYTVTFLTDEYTGNEEIEGAYSVIMNITYENGSEEQIAVQMNVPEPQSEDVIVIEPEGNQTGLERFVSGALNTGKAIANFLVSIFYDFLWKDVIVPVYEWVFVKDPEVIPIDDDTSEEETTTEHSANTLPYTDQSSLPVNEI